MACFWGHWQINVVICVQIPLRAKVILDHIRYMITCMELTEYLGSVVFKGYGYGSWILGFIL